MMESTGQPGSADTTDAADLLLNLPTLAQAAFWVIVVTFAGVLLASIIGGAPIRMEPIVLSLLLLPARAVLANPDKQRAAREDAEAARRLAASGVLGRIAAELNRTARESYGWQRPVGLIIGSDPFGVQAVCSWRRDYLLVGRLAAERMAADLNDDPDTVRAIFLHELAHIAHRDHQRVGFAGELLRGSVTILPWWMLFITFWLGMAVQGIAAALALDFTQLPELDPAIGKTLNDALLPDAAMRADMLARAESTNLASLLIFVFLSFLPIAITGGILYLFFWRWMVRLQEHYADIAARQRGALPYHLIKAMGFGTPMKNAPTRRLWSMSAILPRRRTRSLRSRPSRANWFSMHPTRRERAAVFARPALLYTDWKRVAWSAAVLSVGLDVILAGPLFAYHGLPLHLYMATGILLLSTWLLPQLATRQGISRDLGRALAVIIGVRLTWLALNIALLAVQVLVFPARALVLLNAIAIAGSRYTGPLTELPFVDPMVGLRAAIPAVLLEGLQIGGLLLAVALYVGWMRRARVDGPAAAIRRRHWAGVLIIIAVVYAAMWPLANLIRGM
jgi:hypothetical protein